MSWKPMIDRLRAAGVEFTDGLTQEEVAAVEADFGFRFPPDLRDFLRTAMPVGGRFPDWRDGDRDELAEWLRLPLDDILFDVERIDFWMPEWPERPADLRRAFTVVEQLIADAPTLIPIYGHRMMPDRPSLPGNPVFSVHQTDIICYGRDLEQYLENEFLVEDDERELPSEWRPIEFWDIRRFGDVRWS